MVKFKFKCFSKQDLNSFVSLSKTEYKKNNPITSKKIVFWKHIASPFGPSYIHQISHKNKIVGRIMYEKKALCINNKVFKIFNLSDLLINKNYRHPAKNFLRLIRGPTNFLKKKIVIHTANENSVKLYQNLLKLPNLFCISGYCFPLNPFLFIKFFFHKKNKILDLYFLYKPFIFLFFLIFKLFKIQFSSSEISDKEIEHLKKNYQKNCNPFFDRSKSLISWRCSIYKKKNVILYKVYYKRILLGFFTLVKAKYKMLDCLIIIDFMFLENLNFFHKLILRIFVIYRAIVLKSDLIFFMANVRSSISKVFCGFPFFRINDKFLPHSSPFFVRQNIIKNKDFKNIQITLFDIDYF